MYLLNVLTYRGLSLRHRGVELCRLLVSLDHFHVEALHQQTFAVARPKQSHVGLPRLKGSKEVDNLVKGLTLRLVHRQRPCQLPVGRSDAKQMTLKYQ